MKIVLYLLIFISCVLLLFLGDYLNLPLWPTNFARRTYPLEIHCQIQSIQEESLKQILRNENGIGLELLNKRQKPLEAAKNVEMRTGFNGNLTIHIPQGQYHVRAEIMSYYQNQLHHFASGNPGDYLLIEHRKTNKPIDITLHRLDVTNFSILLARLDRFLVDGDLLAANSLLEDMLTTRSYSFQPNDLKVIKVKKSILESIIKQVNRASALPIEHYVQQLQLYQGIEAKYRSLLPTVAPERYCVKLETETLFIHPRIQALKTALSSIWSEYLTCISNFLTIRNYLKAYECWLQLTQNENFYNQDILPSMQSDSGKIIEYQSLMQKIQEKVVIQINEWIEKGQNLYEKNDLEKANLLFLKAFRTIKEFEQELVLEEEVITDVETYIQDIKYLQTARRYNELKNLEKVKELYSLVTHENQWLQIQKGDLARHKL